MRFAMKSSFYSPNKPQRRDARRVPMSVGFSACIAPPWFGSPDRLHEVVLREFCGLAICILLTGSSFHVQAAPPSRSDFVKLRPVPFTEVQINDSFWAPRRETNRVVSIPVNFD